MDFAASPVSPMDITSLGSPHNTNNDAADAVDIIPNLQSIFDLLDIGSEGDLDLGEFKVGLTSIGVSLTHDEAIILFESIDTENEGFINKESFMEWLSSTADASPQINSIRSKLIVALNAAQEINDPLQDMMDEDVIANILGNKAEYIEEMELIKKEELDDDDDDDADNKSDGTFKINQSDGDESDSLDSEERKAIKKAKIAQQSENAEDLEKTLMQQEMKQMLDAATYALDREISGRNAYREEDAARWKKEEIENEVLAMKQHIRRLSQASLSIDQVQDEVNKTMLEFRKLSADTLNSTKMDNVELDKRKKEEEEDKKKKFEAPKIKISLTPKPVAAATKSLTPKSPFHEIENDSTRHTTSTQPVQIGADEARRNSLSESYSMHMQQQQYVMGAAHPMKDISQYTQSTMQQQLIMRRQQSHPQQQQQQILSDDNKNIILRLFAWYLSPMHQRESLHRLWYHGANAVLSIVICFIMLSLFCLSIAFLAFCGAGLIFTYFQCILSRYFAAIDSRFSYYFFGHKVFPRFSIFIPKSHQESVIAALKEYITDPHMLQVIAYFTFIKLPAAFILSGIAMVIFSGVTSILLSPLIFWLDPEYFEDDLYCLFGSRTADPLHQNKIICNGWAINSFGETFLAFLVFIPALPLTLHLSNFTAKLLCRCTLNFLSINSPNTPPLKNEAIEKQKLPAADKKIHQNMHRI